MFPSCPAHIPWATAHKVIAHANCPVLYRPRPDFCLVRNVEGSREWFVQLYRDVRLHHDHADPPELLEWLHTFPQKPGITYLVHGEPAAASRRFRRIIGL